MSIYRDAYNIEEKILFEDKNIIVCRKESGIPVQSARIGAMDMESMLKNYLAAGNPRQVPFVGVIHRLDQPVEGLLVFGKSPQDTAVLNRQMTGGGFEKRYLAVTDGIPAEKEGTLTDYLKKDGKQNSSFVVDKRTDGARKAVLEYKVLEEDEQTALIEVLLHTGRHHQIRVQFAHRGTPLLGDRKYGKAEQAVKTVALCAYCLVFNHPENGEKMKFYTAPVNGAFQRFSFCKSIK